MSDNKVNNKLDFRNVKTTQFDPGQTNKMAFSELQSAFRHYETNAILRDAYTHFVQELDGDSRPTKVTYYQAISPASDRLNVRADSGGDLAGLYFTLQEFITKQTHVFWFKVSGSGSAPGIGDVEHEIALNNNDPASVVAFAVKNAIEATDEFYVIDSNLLSSYADIQYYQFGDTQALDTGTTGFLSSRLVEGESFEVGEACIEYDVDGNPIWNGNLLKGMVYNSFAGTFQSSGSAGVEDCGPIDFVDDLKENNRLKIDVIGSLNFASTSACAYLNQTTQQNNIDQTGEVLVIDNSPMNTDPVVIDLSTSGEYLITASGNFEFDLKVTADTNDGARRTSRTVLEKFNIVTSIWEEIDINLGSTVAYGYHRNNASGENTASSKIILAVSSNDKFRYKIKCLNNGLIKTVPEGISLSIKQV